MRFFSSLLFCTVALCTMVSAIQSQNIRIGYTVNGKSNTVKVDKFQESVTLDDLTFNDVIKYSFKLVEYDELPEQITMLVGLPETNLEIPLQSTIKEQENEIALINFKFELNNLPKSIIYYSKKNNVPLQCNLIISSDKSSSEKIKIYESVIKFNLNYSTFENLDSFVEPVRYVEQPEIKHIFPDEPKTISPILAKLFVLIVLGVGLIEFITWLFTGCIKFNKLPKGTNSIYLSGLMVSIIGLEWTFYNYYLGSSIFQTINMSTFYALIGLIFGTTYLRNVAI